MSKDDKNKCEGCQYHMVAAKYWGNGNYAEFEYCKYFKCRASEARVLCKRPIKNT